jgi:hypothetical protein
MSDKITSSIVDIPKKAKDKDLCGIEKYVSGLISFIRNSDTPITIAIQGEWGSGKTSLMNSLQDSLCGEYTTKEKLKEHNHEFYGIWINTWQYSLLSSQEETLISIVTSLSAQILNIINVRHKSVGQKLAGTIYGFGSKMLKSVATIAADKIAGEAAADAVSSVLEKEATRQTIKQLRDELQEAINECLENDRKTGAEKEKKGFIFFIDDLDRIDPPVAVQILELLKNIFDLENCIFILAIDYDVVVKGLKPKFGELTDKNEREFRSFFDKIIQMPFSMPVATYSIDNFLIDNLRRIGYMDDSVAKQNEVAEKLSMLCNLSVGTNPRSLKRLLNTISLITIIGKGEDPYGADDKYKANLLLLNFGLICTQIAYPFIYKCLSMDSDYKQWHEGFATKLKLRELSQQEIDKLKKFEEFDEEWEQVLFRICERDNYLSNRVSQVSQMFNIMANLIPEGKNLGETIDELLALSAVTDIQAFDKPKQAIDKGPVLKDLSAKLIPLLKVRLREPFRVVRQQSKKVQSNVFISFSDLDWTDFLRLSINSLKDEFTLLITTDPWCFTVKSDNMRDDIAQAGLIKEFEALAVKFDNLQIKYPEYIFRYPGISSSGIAQKKWHVPHLTFETKFTNPHDILDLGKITTLADFITDFMQGFADLTKLAAEYNAR